MADKVASFGGSWTFIGLFGGVLVTGVIINSVFLMNQGFDPYPYILLNLFLSMLAAIQAPIIMMSQNRQAARDRGKIHESMSIEPFNRSLIQAKIPSNRVFYPPTTLRGVRHYVNQS